MSCREEILDCAQDIVLRRGENRFTILEIIRCMEKRGTNYRESTIRTHITSRLCANAPDNHAVTYDDLERVERGIYRLA
jgi:hypothetical protein